MSILLKPILIITLIILFGNHTCEGGIFSWMFKHYEVNSNNDSKEKEVRHKLNEQAVLEDNVSIAVKVPFEMKTQDEKFFQAMSQFVENPMSQLEICHHKVIYNLKKSCSELSEDELSKVAVNLLNCQSAAEEREIYPCTENMLLRECTQSMDKNTWNAYHIISNRVRAVCYNFRQQQFTAKTEITVNRLIQSTDEQINSMKLLEQSQNALKEATADTLSSLHSGHKSLEKQQEQLSVAHVNIHNYVSSNIKELTREKRLIASGQKELAEITLAIKKKLEEAQLQLVEQGSGQRTTHKRILDDLSDIQGSASRVWEQIDESMKKILEKHELTVSHYVTLMEDLQKMNATVHHLMDISTRLRTKVEEKFSWISALVGDTDATVQKIYSFVLHVCYCLLGMVGASFLQVPYATRMALIILVPLNALSEMKRESSLHFSTLTLVLAVCMFFNLSTIGAVRLYHWRKEKRRPRAVCDGPDGLVAPEKRFLSQNMSLRANAKENSLCSETSILNDSFTVGFSSDEETWRPRKTSAALSSSLRLVSSPPLMEDISEQGDPPMSEGRLGAPRSSSFSAFSKMVKDQTSDDLLNSVRRRLLPLSDESPVSASPLKLNDSRSARRSRSSTPQGEPRFRVPLNQSLTPKQVCSATCKSGLPCKNYVGLADSFCFRHLNGISRESTPAR